MPTMSVITSFLDSCTHEVLVVGAHDARDGHRLLAGHRVRHVCAADHHVRQLRGRRRAHLVDASQLRVDLLRDVAEVALLSHLVHRGGDDALRRQLQLVRHALDFLVLAGVATADEHEHDVVADVRAAARRHRVRQIHLQTIRRGRHHLHVCETRHRNDALQAEAQRLPRLHQIRIPVQVHCDAVPHALPHLELVVVAPGASHWLADVATTAQQKGRLAHVRLHLLKLLVQRYVEAPQQLEVRFV